MLDNRSDVDGNSKLIQDTFDLKSLEAVTECFLPYRPYLLP